MVCELLAMIGALDSIQDKSEINHAGCAGYSREKGWHQISSLLARSFIHLSKIGIWLIYYLW